MHHVSEMPSRLSVLIIKTRVAIGSTHLPLSISSSNSVIQHALDDRTAWQGRRWHWAVQSRRVGASKNCVQLAPEQDAGTQGKRWLDGGLSCVALAGTVGHRLRANRGRACRRDVWKLEGLFWIRYL